MDEVKNDRDAEFLMDATTNTMLSDCCYAPMTEFDGTHGRCNDCKEMSDVQQPETDDHDCHLSPEDGCTHASHMRRIPVQDMNVGNPYPHGNWKSVICRCDTPMKGNCPYAKKD